MRVLVLNDFLAEWTGSEIVALEVAEHFGATTSSFWCVDPVRSVLDDWRPLDSIDLSEFDLVWAQQHAVLPLLDRLTPGTSVPFIVWVSLSPYDVMDKLPPGILDTYADEVVCNSRETATARGASTHFDNAAPNPFHFDRAERPLRRILFVSNNQPAELLEAEAMLRVRGFETRFLGRSREFKRLEPSDIEWADCVVTIGKTVRYALASRTPVYMYDRFGGDGYISPENYATSEANNFSGRPTCRKLDAAAIADEIVAGHRYWTPPEQPRLGKVLDELAARARSKAFARHPDLDAAAAMSTAIGSWMAQAHAWKGTATYLEHGHMTWPEWRALSLKKLRRTRIADHLAAIKRRFR